MPVPEDQTLANLPASVRALIDVIGLQAAITLVQVYGGTILKLPTRARPGGQTRERLALLIGAAAADALIAAYPGEALAMARCLAALRDRRDREIIAAYDAGARVADLARGHRLTERQIRTILKRSPGESTPALTDAQPLQIALF